MNNMMYTYAIILASGFGNRFCSELPKQFTKIRDKTILELSIEAFEQSENIDKIILIITPQYKDKAEEIVSKNRYKKVIAIIEGGKTRKESSCIAINSINDAEANVLIHDCARPLVTQKIISDCANSLKKYNAITVAISSTDTVVEVKNGKIFDMPERNNLKRVQTPQGFKLSLIRKAHQLANAGTEYTDDCSLIFKNNLSPIHIIEGDTQNIKITYPQDIITAQDILNSRSKTNR